MQQNYSKKIEPIQKTSKNTASSVLDASSQSEALQRKADMANNAVQREEAPRPNNTGMPDNLKSGIESLSGFSMDDVRVHYNSSKPATVQALAYTQGTDIHVAPGQEKHLPHEAWHVAQQMAGRVSPTTNINGMPVNDNAALEHEADVMGEKAVQCKMQEKVLLQRPVSGLTAQCLDVRVIGAKPPCDGVLNVLSDLIKFINNLIDCKGEIKKTFFYKFDNVHFNYDNIIEILPFINQLLANSPIDANKVDISKLSGFTDLDSFKKCIKKCIKKEWYKCNLKSTVNIGTEFTFRGIDPDWPSLSVSGWMSRKKEIRADLLEKGFKEALPKYQEKITRFADIMTTFAKRNRKDVEQTQNASKCEGIKARKLSFISGGKEWWWLNVDVDDNCIELQTQAIDYDRYLENQNFFNNLIFISAGNAGLEPATDKIDKESRKITQHGGGGHISLDSGSAFGGDVGVLHRFIRGYTKKALDDVRKGSGAFSYDDESNSPLLNLNANFEAVFRNNPTIIENYVNALKRLYKKKSVAFGQLEKQRKDGVVKDDDLTHYQAVNVDHFSNEGKKKGRIEMRNFDAQKDIYDLLNQVDALFDILADAYIEKEEEEERQRTELLSMPPHNPSTSPSKKVGGA